MKVYNVIQTSNCNGEILVNVTPCADLKSAQAIMDDEIRTLLSEGRYSVLDLDEIERVQNDDDADSDYTLERSGTSFHIECCYDDYILERSDTSFYVECCYDDYYERIEIEEKEIVKIG